VTEDEQLLNKWEAEEKEIQRKKEKHLKLTQKRIEELENMPCEHYHGPEPTEENSKNSQERIKLVNLVGTNRPTSLNNWYDCLTDCHKLSNFDSSFTIDSYKEILLNPTEWDFPHVIKHKGKYYIDGGGKHRLTIGKVIGADEAFVRVTEIFNEDNCEKGV
jgi:hypothetical protein